MRSQDIRGTHKVVLAGLHGHDAAQYAVDILAQHKIGSRGQGRRAGMPEDAGTFSLVMAQRFPEPTSPAEVLIAERARTLDRIAALTRDRDRIVESSSLKSVVDDDPEGAASDFERSQIEALLDQARRHLSDFDLALRRLEEGSYGTCESCGRPIAAERLAARPEASTCITCAAE